jgi:excisionase family DNA binding protein
VSGTTKATIEAAPKSDEEAELTIGQAAVELGLTYRHARRLVAEGKIAARVLKTTGRGPEWRISRDEVERCAAQRRRP